MHFGKEKRKRIEIFTSSFIPIKERKENREISKKAKARNTQVFEYMTERKERQGSSPEAVS